MPSEQTSHALTELAQVVTRLTSADHVDHLNYAAANESRPLFDHQHAAICQQNGSAWKVLTLSDIATVDKTAPFVEWLQTFCQDLATHNSYEQTKRVSQMDVSTRCRRDWPKFAAPYVVWVPTAEGAWLLARNRAWIDLELDQLTLLANVYTAKYTALRGPKRRSQGIRSKLGWAAALAMIGVMYLIPVNLSVLGAAKTIPIDPIYVTAPFDGVVNSVNVSSDESVALGQTLVELEDTELRNQLNLARASLNVVEAELLRAQQAGFSDQALRSQIPGVASASRSEAR